jgi:hypothetical protein
MSALQLLLLFSTSVAGSGLNFHFPTGNSEPVPFEVEVDPAFIEQTLRKASLYRPSIDLLDDSNSDWIEGPPQANMTALADYWANEYDWFETQEIINGNASHYAITIPSVSAEYDHEIHLHLVHEVSAAEDAIPLLLLHGWPSTHLEWSKIIGPLVTPADAGAPSFHIVAPDLPGFGFSPAPSHSGLGPNQTAMVIDKLMHQLGYEQYGIVSTDVGWSVAMAMTDVVADSLLGHFTDFFTVPPNANDLERLAQNLTTPEEAAYIISISAFGTEHSGYSSVQAVSPLAIGQALTDSPVGFAGWVWHLMHGISDGYDYSFEELITHTMMLWIQGTYGNLRWYREFPGVRAIHSEHWT